MSSSGTLGEAAKQREVIRLLKKIRKQLRDPIQRNMTLNLIKYNKLFRLFVF